jgi:hypothetical protein
MVRGTVIHLYSNVCSDSAVYLASHECESAATGMVISCKPCMSLYLAWVLPSFTPSKTTGDWVSTSCTTLAWVQHPFCVRETTIDAIQQVYVGGCQCSFTLGPSAPWFRSTVKVGERLWLQPRPTSYLYFLGPPSQEWKYHLRHRNPPLDLRRLDPSRQMWDLTNDYRARDNDG